MDPSKIVIPPELRPADGRFGSGPSKVRPEAVAALHDTGAGLLGTSHRQAPVKSLVGRLRDGLAEMFSLPDGYEVLLGNGGTTAFWDAQVFGLIENKSHHYVMGEFSSKFAKAAAMADHLDEPEVTGSEPGTRPDHGAPGDADLVAQIHNETSTGVWMPVERHGDGLVSVDATSAAGGMLVEPQDFDVYYFASQKGLASDGGLWIALCSPAAIERIDKVGASGRYIPPSLDLTIALDNSRKNQTYNTPALATVFMASEQVEWINHNGGLAWSAARSQQSADVLYGWAEASEVAWPFVKQPGERSPVVGTIDFADHIDATVISAALRANGIVDTEPYRKLGRNQLRVAMYPAVEPSDVELLTKSIDHVLEVLGS